MILKCRLFYFVFSFLPLLSISQGSFTICNSFDTNTVYISVDTTGDWEIGKPNKTVFDSSFASANSLVTNLNSHYSSNDTSIFYAEFQDEWGGVPNYLGMYSPLEIEFSHRFLTDSITDYGSIEMSLDNGITWYDVLSSEHNLNWHSNGLNANQHVFESTGDTLFDSLAVFGDSEGWVHSKFTKDIENIIMTNNYYPNSVILRFSFISDGIGGSEGWQIDNLCLFMDIISGLEENDSAKEISLYPNPNNGRFKIHHNFKKGNIKIYNLLGEVVYAREVTDFVESAELSHGVYVVAVEHKEGITCSRMVVR